MAVTISQQIKATIIIILVLQALEPLLTRFGVKPDAETYTNGSTETIYNE